MSKAKTTPETKSGDTTQPAPPPPPIPTKAAAIRPIALQEVRWKGRTYRPGEELPAGIDKDTLDRLEALNAIDTE